MNHKRFGVFLAVAFLAGCADEKIEVYKVAREEEPSGSHGSLDAPMSMPAVGGLGSESAASEMAAPHPTKGIHWSIPKGWNERPSSTSMRYATFMIPAGGENPPFR